MNINKWHCNRPLQPRGFHPSWENITAGLTDATDPGMASSGKPDQSSRNHAKQPTLAENATGAKHLGTLSHCDRYCIRPQLCSCVPCIHLNCVSGCCWSPRAIAYQHVFLRPHSDSSTCCSAAYIYNLHALAALPFLAQHGLGPASEENCCGGLASSLTPCKNFTVVN